MTLLVWYDALIFHDKKYLNYISNDVCCIIFVPRLTIKWSEIYQKHCETSAKLLSYFAHIFMTVTFTHIHCHKNRCKTSAINQRFVDKLTVHVIIIMMMIIIIIIIIMHL